MPTFQEDWYGPEEQRGLTELANSVKNLPGVAVEVGCWEGKSTILLANAVHPSRCYAIDHWLGCTGDEKHMTDQELFVNKRDVYGAFLANIAEATNGNVIVKKQDWREVFANWTEPIKIAHIDASHTTEEVRDNILAILPFMVDGGVICGHDYGHKPVYDGIVAALPNHGFNGVWFYIHKATPISAPAPQSLKIITKDPNAPKPITATPNLSRLAYLFSGGEWDTVSSITARHELGHGNAIETESALILYAFVQRFDPITVVETGTHYGFSSACIASALADREDIQPKGRHLHTVDKDAYQYVADRLWENIDVSHIVTHYIGDSRHTRVNVDKPIDFLWLDASHATDDVIAEWLLYAPLLNPEKALVGFHDTTLDPREAEGIKQIFANHLNAAPSYKSGHWLPLRNMRGMDLLLLTNETL
ncbi:MAG: class I SAM-dependent methyltransferase [Caulobacteraceae bacterium]|nr:class I SAM-dependent methyltransferase [Caulobacteraceae bacterium]